MFTRCQHSFTCCKREIVFGVTRIYFMERFVNLVVCQPVRTSTLQCYIWYGSLQCFSQYIHKFQMVWILLREVSGGKGRVLRMHHSFRRKTGGNVEGKYKFRK